MLTGAQKENCCVRVLHLASGAREIRRFNQCVVHIIILDVRLINKKKNWPKFPQQIDDTDDHWRTSHRSVDANEATDLKRFVYFRFV